MAAPRTKKGLFDPRKGMPSVHAARIEFGPKVHEPARTNYFSIYWIRSGAGVVWADDALHAFTQNSLLFFVPYQRIRFEPATQVHADLIHFHANFLCVETFHAEVGCAGVLFNDPYGGPVLALEEPAAFETDRLINHVLREQETLPLAHEEAILACLKLLLILATRCKPKAAACPPGADSRHPLIADLRELIEQNYTRRHAPAAYARLLHVTPKTLGRIVREQLGTTVTSLVQQRILTHAKWQLLHTLRPVKEIALEVGFRDELYFSRMFRKATGFSPTQFRKFETEIRGGSNLSMFTGGAPIQPSANRSDTSRR